MNTCVIVHCWEGYPNYCWYPWLKKELEKKNFNAHIPEMPETNTPTLKKWLPELQKTIKTPNDKVFLVGHSLGCITILRYLESLGKGEKIGGAVLVAGFTDNLGFEELNSFFEAPINYEEIKKHCSNFAAINSDNDPYVPLKQSEILKEKLGASVVIKNKMNHFSGEIENEGACTKLPDVLTSLLDMSS